MVGGGSRVSARSCCMARRPSSSTCWCTTRRSRATNKVGGEGRPPKGDVIIGVNQQPTPNLEAFDKAIERTAKVLAVNIIHDGTQLFLVLQ